ncbi:MAG TPA: hypothetical protein VL443_08250 [Cyclobacteriaceae bacterium]|jgi:hypothetical protein|nr:hypothetical protein [Cyclobacteriaceae bacterium]
MRSLKDVTPTATAALRKHGHHDTALGKLDMSQLARLSELLDEVDKIASSIEVSDNDEFDDSQEEQDQPEDVIVEKKPVIKKYPPRSSFQQQQRRPNFQRKYSR